MRGNNENYKHPMAQSAKKSKLSKPKETMMKTMRNNDR